MRIERVESWSERVPLTRPYTIYRSTTDAVDLCFVRVVGRGGVCGVGSASPALDVTGETVETCAAALAPERLDELVAGREARHLGELCGRVEAALRETPAARAALDVALHDLFARDLGVPLVDFLGRKHDALPTSITLGIRPIDDSLTEADEYLGRGFRCLKVKLGRAIDEDLERLARLRDRVGSEVAIRVDPNEGYTLEETLRLFDAAQALAIELVEQPMSRERMEDARSLPPELRTRLALDESVHDARDALAHAAPPPLAGVQVLKLMKCGGIAPALTMARIAHEGGVGLMWGCMDESRVSITAALHAAYACHATRHLDLDGSLDLARDPASGGFRIVDGALILEGGPGLGVSLET